MVWLIVFAVTIPEILRVEIIKKTALISIRVFFHGYNSRNDSQNSRGRKGTIFYSTLPLPPAHEHPDIYLQLCMWDDYDLFLFATLVFTRLLLDKFYHLIELLFNLICHVIFCLFTWWFDSGFSLQQFDTGSRWTRTRIHYRHCITSEPKKVDILLIVA